MHRINLPNLLTLIGLLLGLVVSPAHAFDDGAVTPFQHPAWFKQSFYDLRDDLDEARRAGKRGVALFFTTQGCAYCRRMLQTTFADPKFIDRMGDAFDVISLEMFADTEITDWRGDTLRIKRFAVREGAQFSPTLIFYDTAGRRLLRLVGYYPARHLHLALDYLADPLGSAQSFRAWLAQRRQAERVVEADTAGAAEDALFTPPPYQLDRSRFMAQQPLLVIFNARDCTACSDFREQVLSEPAVGEALGELSVVYLDTGDTTTPLVTPDGKVTTPAAWHHELDLTRLPALVWFDERGNTVLKTDALVLKARFTNALGYVKDRAYARGLTFQRYARTQRLQRLMERNAER
jgi:thioredoxin-related protein